MLVDDDPFLWLEDVEGAEALSWVQSRNAETFNELSAHPSFESFKERALNILTAEDRPAFGSYDGCHVYNTWQDKTNIRGLFRRASLSSYKSDNPDWNILLDVDQLAKDEGENWILHDFHILKPDRSRALVSLSRGGKDAVVVREFDLAKKSFVDDGFYLDEAKSRCAWLNRDTVLIGSDFGPNSQTEPGYPRTVRIWRRGEKLEAAPTLLEGDATDMLVEPAVYVRAGRTDAFIIRHVSFFELEIYRLNSNCEASLIPLPRKIHPFGVFKGRFLLRLNEDWTPEGGETLTAGSLIALDLDRFDQFGDLLAESVYVPNTDTFVTGVAASDRAIYVSVLDNIAVRLFALRPLKDAFTLSEIKFGTRGVVSINSANAENDTVFISYQDYLTPRSQFCVESGVVEAVPMKAARQRFNSEDFICEQIWTTSKDGTKVPYSLLRHKEIAFDGRTPTLQYGYGGFEVALLPGYVSPLTMQWLEQGGAYVVANIRGGGEFGKEWHEKARKRNRQRAFDDFAAVSEDLIARGVTSPEHLGIQGGSNGGLLMGVMLTQRPDLYKAIVCQVPLLDMRRFHKLLAGASWMAEYGDPDDPEDWSYIGAYSPYQNLARDASYPLTFFATSTRDDRVHPGHARKMAAKMSDMGHATFYFENAEGGHAGVANYEQQAVISAMALVYLLKQLAE